jgi:hypothetical protein
MNATQANLELPKKPTTEMKVSANNGSWQVWRLELWVALYCAKLLSIYSKKTAQN